MSDFIRRNFPLTLILAILFLAAPLQSDAQHYAIVKNNDVNVRSGPDKSYTVEGVAKKGDTVTIISESKGWSEVTTSKNINGFIATSFLEKFGSDTSPIPPIQERHSYWWLILLAIIILFLVGRRLQGRKAAVKNIPVPQSKTVTPVAQTPSFVKEVPPATKTIQPPVVEEKTKTETVVPSSEKEEVAVKDEKSTFGTGDDFEDFIAAKIAGNPYLSLKHRRADAITSEQRISAESGKYPDFDVVFKLQYDNETTEQAFAVECKWRRNFLNGSLQIDSWQIEDYKKYAENTQKNVYLIIGYGGEANKPQKLYLVPLSSITDGNLSADFLKQYEHQADETFYYAPEKRELKLLPVH